MFDQKWAICCVWTPLPTDCMEIRQKTRHKLANEYIFAHFHFRQAFAFNGLSSIPTWVWVLFHLIAFTIHRELCIIFYLLNHQRLMCKPYLCLQWPIFKIHTSEWILTLPWKRSHYGIKCPRKKITPYSVLLRKTVFRIRHSQGW